MMIKAQVNDVVNWIIKKSEDDGQPVTPKKLQKMLYYSYAWGLVFLNESSNELDNKLFDTQFEAWVHGPVVPSIYRQFKSYGYGPIDKNIEYPHFDEETTKILNDVWEAYGHLNGDQLEYVTHQELPWRKKREGKQPGSPSDEKLSDADMFEYYGAQLI
ncbi:MAG: type II toxin-antitoxin system antitoxin SocA domain-containing protein [Leuconostoc pseudomesenteroides]|uniref:Panacea domain-containing protein n=1 Tax=Leuconostoc pseudomesenteroides TaxID=33968 RepID=UPI0039E8684A